MAGGASPLAELEAAERACATAQALEPALASLWAERGADALLRARWESTRPRLAAAGESVEEVGRRRASAVGAALRMARAHLERALRLDPQAAETYVELGRLSVAEAEVAVTAGRSPRASVARGMLAVEQALERKPGLADAHLVGGELRLVAARASRGAQRRSEAAEAGRLLEQGLRLDRSLRWRCAERVAEAARLAGVAGMPGAKTGGTAGNGTDGGSGR
jgi:hypothetical protein